MIYDWCNIKSWDVLEKDRVYVLAKLKEPCRCCIDYIVGVFNTEKEAEEKGDEIDIEEYYRRYGYKFGIITIPLNKLQEEWF